MGRHSDTDLADELTGLQTFMDEGALLSYCQALQAVVAGSTPPMAALADLPQRFQKDGECVAASITHGEQQAFAKGCHQGASQLMASSSRASTELVSASITMGTESGAPVLDSAREHLVAPCSPNSATEQAELLSWHSGSGSESSEEPEVKEDSECEDVDESEEAATEMEEISCCEEDEEESQVDWDSDDDAVDGFASVPTTPPHMEWRYCETPPKSEAPPTFLSEDGYGSDSSDSNAYPMGVHAKRAPFGLSYCNESEHR
jgi:hypothetical protein